MAKANGKPKSITVFCRSCLTRIHLTEQPMLFDIVTCPECEEEFEVVSLSPIRLDWPSDFDEYDKWYVEDDDNLLDSWDQKPGRISR